MIDDPDREFEKAKERAAAKERLRTDRVAAREELTREEYHLRRVEACLALIHDEIERLEQPTLTGLLATVLGNKRHKLGQKREQRDAVQQDADAATRAIASIQTRLEDLGHRLETLGNPEADLLALAELKEKAVLERGDETAARLRDVSSRLARAREETRKTQQAVETGEAIVQRMRTLYSALGRARKTLMHAHAAPFILAGWSRVKARGAKEHVTRVREGLRRFHGQLTALETGSDAQHDLEIARVTPIIEHIFTVELQGGWEQWATLATDAGHPMEREVCAILGHLEERMKHCRQEADALEGDKRRLIGNGWRSIAGSPNESA